jgi:ABC transporter transmembrane region
MINAEAKIGMSSIFKAFWRSIVITWLIVIIENVLIALIPMLIGLSIDGLMNGRNDELFALAAALTVLAFVAVGRRIYDTRVYGSIRLHIGCTLMKRNADLHVSRRSARLDMSRELVNFLESEAPALITAFIQIAVSLSILWLFDYRLGVSSLLVVLGMVAVYFCFHQRFYRLNGQLNQNREMQVDIIGSANRGGIFRHLKLLRRQEVQISDTEALLYGSIFLLQIAFIVYNLNIGAHLPGVTAGEIFSIATYSWEYVEAALLLPVTLQVWTRLTEITSRINSVNQPIPSS